MNKELYEIAASLPAFTDDPVDRLRHVLATYDMDPSRDGEWVIRATSGLPGLPATTGLTWGDLKAILARLGG